MQYKVPQDVQREDTIVGPLTLRQLLILAGGGGVAYATYVGLAQTYFIEVWLPPVAIISAITLAFAFLKIHSLPFHRFLINLIEYKLLSNKRTWTQGTGNPIQTTVTKQENKKKEAQTSDKKPEDIEKISKILDNSNN